VTAERRLIERSLIIIAICMLIQLTFWINGIGHRIDTNREIISEVKAEQDRRGAIQRSMGEYLNSHQDGGCICPPP
jgi:hypothetical protein